MKVVSNVELRGRRDDMAAHNNQGLNNAWLHTHSLHTRTIVTSNDGEELGLVGLRCGEGGNLLESQSVTVAVVDRMALLYLWPIYLCCDLIRMLLHYSINKFTYRQMISQQER